MIRSPGCKPQAAVITLPQGILCVYTCASTWCMHGSIQVWMLTYSIRAQTDSLLYCLLFWLGKLISKRSGPTCFTCPHAEVTGTAKPCLAFSVKCQVFELRSSFSEQVLLPTEPSPGPPPPGHSRGYPALRTISSESLSGEAVLSSSQRPLPPNIVNYKDKYKPLGDRRIETENLVLWWFF